MIIVIKCLLVTLAILVIHYLLDKYSKRDKYNQIKTIDLNSTSCKKEYCGNLVGVDCGAAIDGPYYYVKRDTGKIVSYCGGYCMDGKCTNCPPREWTCSRY